MSNQIKLASQFVLLILVPFFGYLIYQDLRGVAHTEEIRQAMNTRVIIDNKYRLIVSGQLESTEGRILRGNLPHEEVHNISQTTLRLTRQFMQQRDDEMKEALRYLPAEEFRAVYGTRENTYMVVNTVQGRLEYAIYRTASIKRKKADPDHDYYSL